jgi:hypothetical protein
VANRKLGGNVQKLGVCCPILSPHTIRTVPGETNRHGQVIPAISQLASDMDKIRKFDNDMLEKRQQAISKTFSN